MSDMKNFDNFFKTNLENYNSEVPPHIWDNIVAARKKKRPGIFWISYLNNKNILLLAGVFLVGVSGILLSINSNNTTNSTNSNNTIAATGIHGANTSANQISHQTTASLQNSTTENTASNNATNITEAQHGINNTALHNSQSGNVTDGNATNNTEVSTKATDKFNKPTNELTVSALAKNKNAAQINNVRAATNNNFNTNNDYTATSLSHVKAKHTLAHRHNATGFLDGYLAIKGTGGMVDDNTDRAYSTVSNSRMLKGKKHISIFSPQGYLTNKLLFTAEKIIRPSVIDSIEIVKNISTKIYLPECPTVEKDVAGNKQYVEVYVGPDYSIRSLTDTANSAYLQKRKQSTSFSSAFSAGLRYTKVFRSGISIAGGLNYSQINEKFTFVENNISEIVYVIDPVTHDTTGSYTISGAKYKTSYNHYRSVDVPVLFGYELGNDKIHININAGPIMNIYSWQQGQVLDSSSQPESINTGKTSSLAYQYKTNIGLGITGGASVFYKLNDQWHIFAEPYFRYNFSSMTSNESPVQQKYTTVGMHIGLRLDL
jgi:hypothetical protein